MSAHPLSQPGRSRLRGPDLLRLSTAGLRARPIRAALSALGIAIGIAAMVAVLGISSSSQAQLQQQLRALGTNLLTVEGGKDLFGRESPLDPDAVGRLLRVEGVERAAGVGSLPEALLYRSRLIPEGQSGGHTVLAADPELLDVVGGTLVAGAWLTPAPAGFPTAVLGANTAARLGVRTPGTQVWLGGRSVTVIGVLAPVALAPELDDAALVGAPFAAEQLGFTGNPTRLYERSAEDRVAAVRALIPGTVAPQRPEGVTVSRPSDALAAQNASDEAFTGLLLGLGSLGLLIGGIGVANTMIISVMERRREIGLRRALGARRGHIRGQFLGEALVLSALGGLAGAGLGALATGLFAASKGWPLAIPPLVPVAAVGATILVGALAGVVPAWRAARVSPTVALSD